MEAMRCTGAFIALPSPSSRAWNRTQTDSQLPNWPRSGAGGRAERAKARLALPSQRADWLVHSRLPSCSVRCTASDRSTAEPGALQAREQEGGLLEEEPPSCCSGTATAAQGSPQTLEDLASTQRAGLGEVPSPWDLKGAAPLAAAAAVVGLAVVLLASNPSLLPFDVDDVQDWLDEAVYYASHEINRVVNTQLGAEGGPLAPGLVGIVFGAGLITSFAPCTLSVLPLTIGYIAGFNNQSDGEQPQQQTSVLVNSLFFSLGLASTFSTLGITAALAGRAYGQMGPGLPIAVSAITMYMGLNLLGLAKFQVPSLFANFDPKEAAASLPVPVQMYLGGLTFALLASPCSTPVLASLLGFVASSEDVLVGFALLLAYTFGRVMPVLAAASFTGSLKQMLSLRQYSKWVNPASGALLLGIGTFSLLNRVFPESTAMALGETMMMGHM